VWSRKHQNWSTGITSGVARIPLTVLNCQDQIEKDFTKKDGFKAEFIFQKLEEYRFSQFHRD
jgi:hypothetical protein